MINLGKEKIMQDNKLVCSCLIDEYDAPLNNISLFDKEYEKVINPLYSYDPNSYKNALRTRSPYINRLVERENLTLEQISTLDKNYLQEKINPKRLIGEIDDYLRRFPVKGTIIPGFYLKDLKDNYYYKNFEMNNQIFDYFSYNKSLYYSVSIHETIFSQMNKNMVDLILEYIKKRRINKIFFKVFNLNLKNDSFSSKKLENLWYFLTSLKNLTFIDEIVILGLGEIGFFLGKPFKPCFRKHHPGISLNTYDHSRAQEVHSFSTSLLCQKSGLYMSYRSHKTLGCNCNPNEVTLLEQIYNARYRIGHIESKMKDKLYTAFSSLYEKLNFLLQKGDELRDD